MSDRPALFSWQRGRLRSEGERPAVGSGLGSSNTRGSDPASNAKASADREAPTPANLVTDQCPLTMYRLGD